MSGELVPFGEVVDAELVDETCGCGKPGRLMPDPFAADVYSETVMVVLCPGCKQERLDDI